MNICLDARAISHIVHSRIIAYKQVLQNDRNAMLRVTSQELIWIRSRSFLTFVC